MVGGIELSVVDSVPNLQAAHKVIQGSETTSSQAKGTKSTSFLAQGTKWT